MNDLKNRREATREMRAVQREATREMRAVQRETARETREVQRETQREATREMRAARPHRRPRERVKMREIKMSRYRFAVIALVTGLFATLSMTFFCNIKKIDIYGDTRYGYADVVAASGINFGDNMTRLKTDPALGGITSALPYIEHAEFKKVFPNTLKITLEPCLPSANIEYGGGYMITGRSGKILDMSAEPVTGVPVFRGIVPTENVPGTMLVTSDEQKIKIYNTLCAELVKQNMPQINMIDMTDKYEIKMTYAGRIEIEFGNWSEIGYKLSFIKKLIEESLPPESSGYLIMRGSNGVSFIKTEDMDRYIRTLDRKREAEEAAAAETTDAGEVTTIDN